MTKTLFATAALFAMSITSFIGMATASSSDKLVAVVLPPWWDLAQSVAAAGESGPIVSVGGLPFIVVIANDPARGRLRGEWLRLHLSIIPGCFGERSLT